MLYHIKNIYIKCTSKFQKHIKIIPRKKKEKKEKKEKKRKKRVESPCNTLKEKGKNDIFPS